MDILWFVLAPFSWLANPLGLLAYVGIALGIWYVYYTLECCLNGGDLGRNFSTMAFSLFYEQLLWSIPGGLSRKSEYVKNNLVRDWENGGVCGSKQFWEYAEVREKNLYVECARDVMPGPLYFWIVNVGAPILWPVSLSILLALIVLSVILKPFEPILEPLFEKYFG